MLGNRPAMILHWFALNRLGVSEPISPRPASGPRRQVRIGYVGRFDPIKGVLDLADARRRRTRWRFLATAAAVVAIAGGLFGGLSSITTTRAVPIPVSAAGTNWETVEATSSVTGASASVAYSHELWGDAFEVLVDNIPVGTTCQLWVVHPNGTRTQVAAWTTAKDEGNVWYSGSMAATAQPISKFQITADHKVLLTARPT